MKCLKYTTVVSLHFDIFHFNLISIFFLFLDKFLNWKKRIQIGHFYENSFIPMLPTVNIVPINYRHISLYGAIAFVSFNRIQILHRRQLAVFKSVLFVAIFWVVVHKFLYEISRKLQDVSYIFRNTCELIDHMNMWLYTCAFEKTSTIPIILYGFLIHLGCPFVELFNSFFFLSKYHLTTNYSI